MSNGKVNTKGMATQSKQTPCPTKEVAENRKIENGSDSGSADEDESLLDVPIMIVDPSAPVVAVSKPERPSDGLIWNDNAIEECFQVALNAHDAGGAEVNVNDDGISATAEWVVPVLGDSSDQEILSSWTPKTLPLPFWAVSGFQEE